MDEQLQLDLFGELQEESKTPFQFFLDWAHETHKCNDNIDAIARDVFEQMPDPFDRCKALINVFRCGRDGSEIVQMLGLFDDSISYHTCWDREWAYIHDVPLELIGRIHRCDYRCGNGNHVFYDADSAVVWECEGKE